MLFQATNLPVETEHADNAYTWSENKEQVDNLIDINKLPDINNKLTQEEEFDLVVQTTRKQIADKLTPNVAQRFDYNDKTYIVVITESLSLLIFNVNLTQLHLKLNLYFSGNNLEFVEFMEYIEVDFIELITSRAVPPRDGDEGYEEHMSLLYNLRKVYKPVESKLSDETVNALVSNLDGEEFDTSELETLDNQGIILETDTHSVFYINTSNVDSVILVFNKQDSEKVQGVYMLSLFLESDRLNLLNKYQTKYVIENLVELVKEKLY